MRLTARLTLISLAVLGSALAAGEATVRDFELTDNVFLTVRAHDLARSRQRFQASPYGRFFASKSGQVIGGRLRAVLETATEGKLQNLLDAWQTIEGAGLTLGITPETFKNGPRLQLAVGCADPAKLLALGDLGNDVKLAPVAGAQVPSWRIGGEDETLLEQHGRVLVLAVQEDPQPAVVRAAAPAVPLDADREFELVLDLKTLMQALEKSGEPVPPEAKSVFDRIKSASFQLLAGLNENGMNESITYRLPGLMEGIGLTVGDIPLVDKQVFSSLPPGTLWAVAWNSSAAITEKVLQKFPAQTMDQATMMIDMILVQAGLPKYLDLVKSFDGNGVAYLELADDKPVLTFSIGAKEVVAKQLVAFAKPHLDKANAEPCPPELKAVLGYEPKLVLDYADGDLVFTTHPQGLAGVTQRAGGFAQQPAVQAALARLPDTGVALGVSNSPASWRFVGDMITKAMMQDEAGVVLAQLLATLPDDLAAAARLGCFSAAMTPDGTVTIQAEGVLTPTATYGAVFGAAGFFVFRSIRPGMRGPAVIEPLPPGGVEPPPPPTF
jgi:hypothetical protein